MRTNLNFFILTVLFFALAPVLPASARTLYLGLSGSDVKSLQAGLIEQGYLAADNDSGYFGLLTEAALKKFQCAQNIACSSLTLGYGVYGPKTKAAFSTATSNPKNPATITGSMTPAATGKFEISGWLPYWRVSSSTRDTLPHLSILTSAMPFSYTVRSDGTLADTANMDQDAWTSFIKSAKAAGVRIVPTILWGNGDTMQKILGDTNKRIALENAIAKLVKSEGFDGIDIDFEAKQHATINYFSTFLRGLYSRMGNKWVYCTVEARMPLEDRYLPGAKIPPDATDYANDYMVMNKYCDRVEIMAYDQGTIDVRLNAARTAPYAPVADPGWVEELARLASQTISRNKLILGIPTYGYEYRVTKLSGSQYKYKVLWPFNPGYASEIAAKLNITPWRTSANEMGLTYDPNLLEPAPDSRDTIVQQDTMASTSVAENADSKSATPETFNYVTWSDAQAIKDKVELAKRLGLRGVAVFKFDGGEDQAMWNVLREASER